MEIAITIILAIVAIAILVFLSAIIAIGCFIAAIVFFIQGEIWWGIGMLVLSFIAGAISNARDGETIYVVFRR